MLGCSKQNMYCARLRTTRVLGFWILILGGLGLPGCYVRPTKSPLTGSFYLNPDKEIDQIGRVAMVELDNESKYPDISKYASESLYIALQKKRYFGINWVTQVDPKWRGLQLEADDAKYDMKELVEIRKTLKCDAVLGGTVTEYRPYPHLTLGLRLRLFDLRDGSLVWAIEHLWNSEDLESKERLSYYLKKSMGKSTVEQELMEMSSLEFMKFAAFEVADTLSDIYESTP